MTPIRLALALTASLVLVGCSGDNTTASPTTPAEASQQATTDPAIGTAAPPLDVSTWTPEPAPSGQDGQPRGLDLDPAQVDQKDPIAVANAFAATILTSDASIDLSPVDADRRAARWATDDYAATLTEPRPGSGGADWLELERDSGYLSAELSEHPAVEAGLLDVDGLVTEVPILATVTAHDADLPPRDTSVLVTLIRTDTDQPWQVTDWYDDDAQGGTP